MLSADQLARLTTHCEARYACTIVTRDEGPVGVALDIVRTLARLISPALAAALDTLDVATGRVSTTLPLPTGTLIVLSPAAVADALAHARTLIHEAVHARQIQDLGGWQATVDYLGSGELRALREAHACVAAAWLEYLLTGELPTDPSDVVRSLESHLYLLNEGERELARGIAASNLETIREGGIPPLHVCLDLLGWLREHAPEALAAHRTPT